MFHAIIADGYICALFSHPLPMFFHVLCKQTMQKLHKNITRTVIT